jgi:imidazolonepropionase-like amidohydrolase
MEVSIMRKRIFARGAFLGSLLLAAWAGGTPFPGISGPRLDGPAARLVFKDIRVFDGRKIIPLTTVVIEGSKIVAVGTNVAVPAGAEIIDGRNMTLLPGLIDSHVHIFSPGELRRSLMFGVTTVMDMMTMVGFMRPIKARQAATGTPDMADLFSAGLAATVPGGHGTEYGGDVPTLTKADEVSDFVAKRKAEGSDYLKIMSGRAKYVLGKDVVAALAAEARKQGLLSLVHINIRSFAQEAVQAGVNGLAHCFADAPPERDLIDLMKVKNVFVIPTLSVMNSLSDAKKADLIHDQRLVPYISPDILEALGASGPNSNPPDFSYRVAEEAARRFHEAGIRVLAGSDTANPGTSNGISLHGELELLVVAGMKPVDALAAATSVPADVFGLKDRGRIAPGLRADLLLVRGNPAEDVTATRDIAGVWKLGVKLDRDSYRVRMEALQKSWKETATLPPPDGSESGLISGFDSGDYFTNFGFTWFETTDAMMGGKSKSVIDIAPGGAENTAGSLVITGEMKPGSPFPWAGAAFFPGITEWSCANLSSWNAISFWAKGGTGKAVVLLILQGKPMPAFQLFTIGEEWKKYEFPFSGFGKTDGTDIMGLVIGAAETPGPFKIQIDQVRLVRIPIS